MVCDDSECVNYQREDVGVPSAEVMGSFRPFVLKPLNRNTCQNCQSTAVKHLSVTVLLL